MTTMTTTNTTTTTTDESVAVVPTGKKTGRAPNKASTRKKKASPPSSKSAGRQKQPQKRKIPDECKRPPKDMIRKLIARTDGLCNAKSVPLEDVPGVSDAFDGLAAALDDIGESFIAPPKKISRR